MKNPTAKKIDAAQEMETVIDFETLQPVFAAMNSTLEKFSLFEKVPDEIKLKIMKMSLPGERTVELRFADHHRSRQYDFQGSIPSALHVSLW